MYSLGGYTVSKIFDFIKIYVESGIPVVTTIGNQFTGHVMNIVGRTEFDYSKNFTFSVCQQINGANLYDYYEQPCRYLVVDDNLTPYSTITLDDPAFNYGTDNVKWSGCKIDGAIIPLYHRVYMDAEKAKELAFEWLDALSSKIKFPDLVVRTLLASSRSYKDYIASHLTISDFAKNEIIKIDMPKFLWLVELTTPKLIPKQKACGMMFIDATEPKKGNLLGMFINNIYLKPTGGKIQPYTLPLPPFKIFHNLKPF